MRTPYPDNCLPDNQREDDYELAQDDANMTENGSFSEREDYDPVYATLHFYYNDPDSMRRMRECLDAPKWKSAVWDFDQWLRSEIKYHGAGEDAQTIRDHLHVLFDEQGIDIWEE